MLGLDACAPAPATGDATHCETQPGEPALICIIPPSTGIIMFDARPSLSDMTLVQPAHLPGGKAGVWPLHALQQLGHTPGVIRQCYS
jgi:hypothetical protein